MRPLRQAVRQPGHDGATPARGVRQTAAPLLPALRLPQPPQGYAGPAPAAQAPAASRDGPSRHEQVSQQLVTEKTL